VCRLVAGYNGMLPGNPIYSHNAYLSRKNWRLVLQSRSCRTREGISRDIRNAGSDLLRALGKRLQRSAPEDEQLCRKRVHWLAILIQISALDLDDGLVWLGPRWQNFNHLAFHAQSISSPRWIRPRQLAAQSDELIA
jgi:hypothetical protein